MKKSLIAALIGGLILFIWQFLSWTMLNIHGPNMTYTPMQDNILKMIETEGLQEGSYFMPTVAPGASMEAHEALQTKMVGKPWALIQYHKSFEVNMGMNMFRGFLIDFLSVFFLIWILMANPKNTFKHTLIATVLVGLIGYFTISYLDSIWFESNSIPELIDTLISWGLVGLWLGWFLNRKA